MAGCECTRRGVCGAASCARGRGRLRGPPGGCSCSVWHTLLQRHGTWSHAIVHAVPSLSWLHTAGFLQTRPRLLAKRQPAHKLRQHSTHPSGTCSGRMIPRFPSVDCHCPYSKYLEPSSGALPLGTTTSECAGRRRADPQT